MPLEDEKSYLEVCTLAKDQCDGAETSFNQRKNNQTGLIQGSTGSLLSFFSVLFAHSLHIYIFPHSLPLSFCGLVVHRYIVRWIGDYVVECQDLFILELLVTLSCTYAREEACTGGQSLYLFTLLAISCLIECLLKTSQHRTDALKKINVFEY